MNAPHTTYTKAVLAYNEDHERALLDAIIAAIISTSQVSDANAVVVRTGEIAQALTAVLAMTLAMSPSTMRSPSAIRKITDDINRRLRQQSAAATKDTDLQEAIRRMFGDGHAGGNA